MIVESVIYVRQQCRLYSSGCLPLFFTVKSCKQEDGYVWPERCPLVKWSCIMTGNVQQGLAVNGRPGRAENAPWWMPLYIESEHLRYSRMPFLGQLWAETQDVVIAMATKTAVPDHLCEIVIDKWGHVTLPDRSFGGSISVSMATCSVWDLTKWIPNECVFYLLVWRGPPHSGRQATFSINSSSECIEG